MASDISQIRTFDVGCRSRSSLCYASIWVGSSAMKRKLFSAVVTAGLFTSFTPAWAATCTTAPVSTYTAAGFSCNIGGLTFSNIVVTPFCPMEER